MPPRGSKRSASRQTPRLQPHCTRGGTACPGRCGNRSRAQSAVRETHAGCGERSGGCERDARSSLLRRAFRHGSSVVAALPALAPRLAHLARHGFSDSLLLLRASAWRHAVALQHAVEGAAVDAEHLRGPAHVAPALLEDAMHVATLELRQRGAVVGRGARRDGPRPPELLGQILGGQHLLLRERHAALEHVRHIAPPTGRIWCSWRTRRSFAWSAGDTSPISSRKIVPPSASAKSPGASPIAPVKAPRTCPKSSLSSSVSVRPPQSTATNGRLRRGLFWWMARAISSLPVPLSPRMSTVLRPGATRAIVL